MIKRKVLSCILIASMSMAMIAGCDSDGKKSKKNRSGDDPEPSFSVIDEGEIDYDYLDKVSYEEDEVKEAYLKFALAMYAENAKSSSGANMMISPASILFAMEMASAGASGETLRQMTEVMAPGIDPDELLKFASDYNEKLNNASGITLSSANSVWMNSTFVSNVYQDYINYVRDHFDAEAQVRDFDDDTLDAINKWIEEKTDGMIKDAVDKLEPSNLMLLINAICFEAEWMEQYEDYQINEEEFTTTNGTKINAEMMNSVESIYLQNEYATGFMKYYSGGEYAFVAMLPKDASMSASEFASSMTAEDYLEFLNSRTYAYDVRTKLLKFISEYNVTLNDPLISMGMEDAFDPSDAEFGRMCDLDSMEDQNVYISKVIHKTFIDVNENGTRAAAVTVVTMDAACAMPEEKEYKEVYLNRPFAYAIVDVETGLPLFIGTVESPEC